MDQPSDNAHSERKISSEFVGHNPKKTFFSNAPLFVGFNPKGSESDSVRSPTSPLDLRVFSFLGNPLRSQRSSHEKVWYRNKVGLSIVDSLDFESEHSGKVIRASDSKNILFKPQLRTKPMDSKINSLSYAGTEVTKSLPKYVAINPSKKESSNVCFEIGDSSTSLRSFSFDSRQSRSRLSRLSESSSLFRPSSPVSDSKTDPTSSGPNTLLNRDIPPSEIEQSEDYTCVKIHGPNPKVTHIFCDCILECNSNGLSKSKEDEKGKSPAPSMAYPFCDFLRFCYSCKKNLDGEDIYMYRGEKAFCSSNCRLQVILLDEEMEKSNVDSCDDSSEQKNGNESSTASLFISM